jgi:cytochrome c553
MRKLLRLLGWAAAVLAAIAVIALTAVYWSSNRRLDRIYTLQVQPVSIPTGAAAIAQGRHLALTRGCMDCHGEDLGGRTVIDDPAMGLVAGPNLTRGEGGLPADFRDEDWIRSIRHGVGRDGRPFFLMPSTDYATFSDADMGALVAFLKSVPPVNRPRVPVKIGPVARGLMAAGAIKLSAEEIDHAGVRPAVIIPGLTVAYGRYVANSCTGCHGPNFSGGKIASGPPDWPPAANLTPHEDGKLRGWSEADFLQALRTGKRPDGTEINPVMPRAFAQLNETEQKSIWMFLQTLPAAATGAR